MRLTLCFKIMLWAVLTLTGCSHYTVNPALKNIDPSSGYRYSVVRPMPSPDKPFVILAFSGGGTRAAAFSYGLLKELKTIEYTTREGEKRQLLDDVEIISSVSGGSFTSAYYTLFPDRFFNEFPTQVLHRNIEKDLIGLLFHPQNWFRLASKDFSRIDLAEEYYNETLFQGKTFGDLVSRPKGNAPFLVLNATDISITHRFEFTQDQFDLLCSDLSTVSIAKGVAASSNFPVAFAPLTLNNYHQEGCGPLPGWIDPALSLSANPDRRYFDALAAMSYRDKEREFCHLLDGGLSDNLGLRGPFDAVTTTDSAWSILKQANLKKLKTLMIIAVNAKTTKHHDWDKKSHPPGIKAVLGVVTGGPMDDVSLDSVDMTDNHFSYMKQLSDTVDACNTVLHEKCPEATPVKNPIGTNFSFSELSFERVKDPCVRRYLQELPTSLALDAEAVELLIVTAAQLLNQSEDFIKGMQALDPNWKPRTITLPEHLVRDICKSP
jgi:predicted acylesterase/phospholipase RssA